MAAQCVLTAWVTVLASASCLAPGWLPGSGDTVMAGVGLASLLTYMGEGMVREDGRWVAFAVIHVRP